MKSLSVRVGVVLIVGLLMLGYAEVCKAQCAWVLWESNSNDGFLHWQVNDAFPSYEKCKQSQLIECEQRNKTVSTNITNTLIKQVADKCPDSLIIFYKDSSHPREIVYKCLPDTIDPRK